MYVGKLLSPKSLEFMLSCAFLLFSPLVLAKVFMNNNNSSTGETNTNETHQTNNNSSFDNKVLSTLTISASAESSQPTHEDQQDYNHFDISTSSFSESSYFSSPIPPSSNIYYSHNNHIHYKPVLSDGVVYTLMGLGGTSGIVNGVLGFGGGLLVCSSLAIAGKKYKHSH